MHNQSYVSAQLAPWDRNKFNYLVRKYQGDNYVKVFSNGNQLKVLMFGQMSRRESLRDLFVAVEDAVCNLSLLVLFDCSFLGKAPLLY